MADGAIQTVRREAHALAGAARNVGLPRLADGAGALQKSSEGPGRTTLPIETPSPPRSATAFRSPPAGPRPTRVWPH